MNTNNYMDVSASQSSFWDNDDSRPESPSLIQDRQAFFNGVERIKIKIQQKAPLYISSDQYGASKILQVKIQDLNSGHLIYYIFNLYYDWLNLSINSFKIKCKNLFLLN